MALGCEEVEKVLEDWEDVHCDGELYDIRAARQGREGKRAVTGPGAPGLEIYNWSIFDRLSGAFLCARRIHRILSSSRLCSSARRKGENLNLKFFFWAYADYSTKIVHTATHDERRPLCYHHSLESI